ncbi:hypothetical protein MUK42_28691 [Musa troglodytarum]|uniref:Uncharacterized protein n=1 Tax=Musa troglodytarum TaxID=320322 RepID=A0A9E7G470_9LILI|nr:hypothetical protein MUK42_28691 [Musa troglodytarum]
MLILLKTQKRQGCNLSSVREGRDLQALAADESAEEAVRGDEGEQHITRHRREGEANRGRRPLAEAAEDIALFAPRYLYVPVVCQVHYLGRHRSGRQDCVCQHLPQTISVTRRQHAVLETHTSENNKNLSIFKIGADELVLISTGLETLRRILKGSVQQTEWFRVDEYLTDWD